jgi:hypothetical protein
MNQTATVEIDLEYHLATIKETTEDKKNQKQKQKKKEK